MNKLKIEEFLPDGFLESLEKFDPDGSRRTLAPEFLKDLIEMSGSQQLDHDQIILKNILTNASFFWSLSDDSMVGLIEIASEHYVIYVSYQCYYLVIGNSPINWLSYCYDGTPGAEKFISQCGKIFGISTQQWLTRSPNLDSLATPI